MIRSWYRSKREKLDRWYARTYVCPFWGHKPSNIGVWNPPDNNPEIAHIVVRRIMCATCGETYDPTKQT